MTPREDPPLLQIVQKPRPDIWSGAAREPAIDPDLPIIDAHHHFSEHWGGYMPTDLLDDAASLNLVASVYVQCGWHYRSTGPDHLKHLGETEAVLAAVNAAGPDALSHRVAAGIVGYVDLCGDHVDEALAAQIDIGQGRFRGVRYSAARDPEFKHGVLPRPAADLYRSPDFRRGYGRLASHRLSFDAWIYHPQLRDVAELAGAFPETPLILDHLGGPLGVARYAKQPDLLRSEWLPWMKTLAGSSNVTLKLGGLGTAVFGFDVSERPTPPTSSELADLWRPLIEPALELFGAERCMFESNFPVDRSGADYGTVWNAFKRLTSGATPTEKAALFHDTAKRVYRL